MDTLLVPLSFLNALPFKMGPTECSEMFQNNHQSMQQTITKQRRHKLVTFLWKSALWPFNIDSLHLTYTIGPLFISKQTDTCISSNAVQDKCNTVWG
jgi:hypothetical protein